MMIPAFSLLMGMSEREGLLSVLCVARNLSEHLRVMRFSWKRKRVVNL